MTDDSNKSDSFIATFKRVQWCICVNYNTVHCQKLFLTNHKLSSVLSC